MLEKFAESLQLVLSIPCTIFVKSYAHYTDIHYVDYSNTLMYNVQNTETLDFVFLRFIFLNRYYKDIGVFRVENFTFKNINSFFS